jgi:carbamoyl-phosphate synthase small subunit
MPSLRSANERVVLQAVRLHGAPPAAEIARLSTLTAQTVSLITKRLLDDGLLLKGEPQRGKVGQPSVPLALNPDGVFLSNGPGDPAATGAYAVPMIRGVLDRADIPLFGICLGHQMLALALGARTIKMNHGHHGANHPVKDVETGKVEITSMNHGFTVDSQTLPAGVKETHVSLFDGSNCGIRMTDRPVFSVQYHPEASPGPQDSYYLFERFAAAMEARRG